MSKPEQNNFRILPESAEEFRKICTEYGLNQAQGFAHILQVFELNKAKEKLVKRETEIEEFERHVKALLTAYIGSLELAENADARMFEKYENDLKSKDKTIQDLQAKNGSLEAQIELVRDMRNKADEKVKEMKEKLESVCREKEAAEKAVNDKENLNQMLQTRLAEVDGKAKEYDALKKQTDLLIVQVSELQREAEKEARESEIRQEKAVQRIADEKDSEILKLEKENSRLNALYEQGEAAAEAKVTNAKLEAAQQISNLEKRHNEELKELYEQIRSLEKQLMTLQTPTNVSGK